MQTNNLQLLAATNNKGKIKELKELLADLPFELKGLNDFANISEVEETGTTFEENAILKAKGYANQTGIWAVADDSGLEIEALNGAPGVYSARYGGADSGYDKKNEMILAQMAQTGSENRAAQFVCVMAISDEKGEIKHLAQGVCRGKIAFQPGGTNGFGFDPIFVPDGYENTFGELSNEIKQKISHRGVASAEIIRFLRDFIII
ncbi:MAG: RdgB/HAM1 family non-canonical purine NTP pyrophosphatase [Pyrinomonadaceae bacterium]|nr:RdgB/HAM1 family non-canonical purine NTP pyrophosphatase [Pyrinomonadaceae bacterium]